MDKEMQIIGRIYGDKTLIALRRKINEGKGTFEDTADYSERAAKLLGKYFSKEVLSMSAVERIAMNDSLLRDRYKDINELLDIVQQTVDEAQGIHIRPQHAPYNEERADQIGRSLTDKTVSDEVIERRAKSAPATVAKAMHDDYIKKNAQFRHDAGLKCYIIRIGTKCCEWCSDVAGKYEFGDQPDGIFRRHDNCDCTIIYDGQVLRGKQNPNGSRSKTWEELPNANAADYTPPSLSEEQGRAIEQRNLGKIKGLTSAGHGGTIRNIEIGDISTAIKGGTIQEDVAKTIIDTLGESNSQNLFDGVTVVRTDHRIVMQTDPVKKGTFFDTRLNLNENFLGEKSVEEINDELRNSDFTVANSLREAVIHEKYHAKLISGLNQDQLEALYDILSDYHIDGISKTAWKDGSECIAEIGVLFDRGETDDLPQEAKDLFNKYIGGIL